MSLTPGLLFAQASGSSDLRGDGQMLFAELGCSSCHTDLKIGGRLREQAPDLTSAGLRYNQGWLLEFLQKPVKVRQHLGRARMPDFHLNSREALALVTFLESQRAVPGQWPEFPAAIQSQFGTKARDVSQAEFQTVLADGLLCLTCHTVEGAGGNKAVEFTGISYRLQPDWVKKFLVAPAMFGVAATNMPAQFYSLADADTQFHQIIPRAAEKIQIISDYLFSLNRAKRDVLEQKLRAARASFPDATAALGEKIFAALNCAACHRHQAIAPRTRNVAPDLTQEGARVNRAWLEDFLKHPGPIRPFGYRPGDGSRMPDFRLSESEAASLSSWLRAQQSGTRPAPFAPRKLSAFSRRKATALLTEKLSCLGCHRLGEIGGRIGPDLTNIRARLQPAYAASVIKNPRGMNPHAVMPQIPLPPETIELVMQFLLQQETRSQTATYPSLTETALSLSGDQTEPPAATSAASLYASRCAGCHGNDGQGNGFNAQFLPVKPTMHADAASMSRRADDTLYDGIHSGGYILNKSQFMPPWGGSLSPEEMRGLVAFMRTLCKCQGPAWSLEKRP